MPLRVLIVGDFLPDIGGVSQYVLNLSLSLIRYGFNIIVFHTKRGLDIYLDNFVVFRLPVSILFSLNYTFKGLKYSVHLIKRAPFLIFSPKQLVFALVFAGKFDDILKKYKISIIHSNHLSLRSLVACIVARENKVPCIITTHGYDTEYPLSFGEYFLRKACVELASKIIVQTKVKSLRMIKLYNGENLVTVPNFIQCMVLDKHELHRHKYVAKEILGYSNKIVVTYVGRIVEEKGVFDIIKIAEYLKSNRIFDSNKIIFLIAGSGPDEQKIKHLVDDKKLSELVVFLGPIFGHQKLNLLLASDIILLPTYLSETFPISLIEAMNYGVIPIVYYFKGVEEIIRNEKDGFILPRGDIQALLNVIEKIVSGKVDLQQMQIKTFISSKKYCSEHVVPKIRKVYYDVLNSGEKYA